MNKTWILAALVIGICTSVLAEEQKAIALPKPKMEGGKPLMQVLKERTSSREFAAQALPEQTLSDLLWAACGVNRPDGRRTAPTAMNKQEIDVYVALEKGLYLYDAAAHALTPVLAEDVRGMTGGQPFVKTAPVNLIFVADFARMSAGSDEDKALYSATDTGFISQNVYLFCTSEGLATVVRGWVDKKALAAKMSLRPEQRIVLAQTVGYPAGK